MITANSPAYHSIAYPNLWTLRPAYHYSGEFAVSNTDRVLAVAVVGDYVYAGGEGGSAVIKQALKTTMVEAAAALALSDNVAAILEDPVSHKLIVATVESPARIYILNIPALTISGSLVLNSGEGTVKSMAHDGTNLFVLCGTSPSKVVLMTTTGAAPVRVAALTLSAGENAGRSITTDGQGNAYLGTMTAPAKVVKVNNTAGVLTRIGAVTLAIGPSEWDNCGGVAFDDFNSGKACLYAIAGGTNKLEVLFRIDHNYMTIVDAAGGRFRNLTFTDAKLDKLSINPGKYLYVCGYDADTNIGLVEAWDIGSQGGGMRSSRRFTMNNPDIEMQSLTFDGTYLYICSNEATNASKIIKFDRSYLGLVLYCRPGYAYSRPVFGESFNIVGLDNPISRIYAVHGRDQILTHVVIAKDTFDYTRKQVDEDEATIMNCRPIGFLHDWGEWGRAVALLGQAPTVQYSGGPGIYLAEITFPAKETAV